MTAAPRAFHEKNVSLANSLKIHYYEWAGPKPNLVLLHPCPGHKPYSRCRGRRG